MSGAFTVAIEKSNRVWRNVPVLPMLRPHKLIAVHTLWLTQYNPELRLDVIKQGCGHSQSDRFPQT
jgi:hypothetical protein